ncbi:MAG: hypothetical protein II473_02270 [Clostridia bacterium]|nr:hypothetical protein [Clostridia bacterium]MBQ2500309.1 hypothetical protein [Clostridia bacterium]
MDKLKNLPLKWSITLALLVATLFMAIFATAYKLPQIYKYEKDLAGRNTAKNNEEFLKKSIIEDEDEAPYLETGINNYFYTANFNGDITFYRFNGEQFKKVRSSSSAKVKLPGTKNEVTVYFIRNNEEVIGIGVYSNKKAKEKPYAFLKVIQNDITENYDYIAFVDYTVEDYYSNNKTFESAFAFSKSNSETEVIFELDPKTSFIPIDLIEERKDGFYFFKKNADTDGYGLYLQTTVSGKEVTISENIALPYAFVKDGDLLLLEYADIYREELSLQSTTKFILTQVTGITTDYRREFDYEPESYIVKGNYILSPEEKILYDVIGDTVQAVRTEVALEGITDFALSDGAAKIALIGHVGTEADKFVFFEFATNRAATFSGKNIFMPGNENIAFYTENFVGFLSPASNSNYCKNVIIPWEDLF